MWTHGCFRGEVGGPKTLNSFSGFVWLAQILRTFTFCGELLRINRVARDSWIQPQECRRFYIYRDVWLLTLPSIGPLPLRYPNDLHAVRSASLQRRGSGPLSLLWERPGRLRAPVVCHSSAESWWMPWRQCTPLWWAKWRTAKYKTSGLEIKLSNQFNHS